MDGEKGVIPPGKPYIFGDREMQTGVYALVPSNLPAPIDEADCGLGKACPGKSRLQGAPSALWCVGGDLPIRVPRTTASGTHCDNDYWAKEYNKIVLMTAIGSASIALIPTPRLKAPICVADDDTVFIFNQNCATRCQSN